MKLLKIKFRLVYDQVIQFLLSQKVLITP
jgi:hypothetical protein